MSSQTMTANVKIKLLPYIMTMTTIIKEKEDDIEGTISAGPQTRNDTNSLL